MTDVSRRDLSNDIDFGVTSVVVFEKLECGTSYHPGNNRSWNFLAFSTTITRRFSSDLVLVQHCG